MDLISAVYQVIGPPPDQDHSVLAAALVTRPQSTAANAVAVGGAMGGVLGALTAGALATAIIGAKDGDNGKPHPTLGPKEAKAVLRAQQAIGVRPEMIVAVTRYNFLLFSTNQVGAKKPKKLVGKVATSQVRYDGLDGQLLYLHLHDVPVLLKGKAESMHTLATGVYAAVHNVPIPQF